MQKRSTFIGIGGFDATVTDKLQSLYPEQGEGVRLTAPRNMHITLQYLGHLAEEDLPTIAGKLKELPFTPFDLIIKGTVQMDVTKFHYLCASVEPSQALLSLQMSIGECLALESRHKSFKPHITLARIKGQGGELAKAFHRNGESLVIGDIPITQFAIYQAIEDERGKFYKPVYIFQ